MTYTRAAALLLLLFALPSFAGTVEETIFKSGFEFNEGCTIFDGSGDHIDIRSIMLSGDMTLNGGPFPNSEYSDGWFSLRDRVTTRCATNRSSPT